MRYGLNRDPFWKQWAIQTSLLSKWDALRSSESDGAHRSGRKKKERYLWSPKEIAELLKEAHRRRAHKVFFLFKSVFDFPKDAPNDELLAL